MTIGESSRASRSSVCRTLETLMLDDRYIRALSDSLDTEQLALLLHRTETDLGSSLGDEHLVSGQVTGSGVVSAVRDSP